MNTSLQTSFLSEIADGNAQIPPDKLAYFQARTKNRIYDFIVKKFVEKERAGKLNKAILARRLGSDPAVITRLLGAPGNWTLDTVSNLLLGIAAEELQPDSASVLDQPPRNYAGQDRASGSKLMELAASGEPVTSDVGKPASVQGIGLGGQGLAGAALARPHLQDVGS